MDETFLATFISFLGISVSILYFLVNHERRLTRIEAKLDLILRFLRINNNREREN